MGSLNNYLRGGLMASIAALTPGCTAGYVSDAAGYSLDVGEGSIVNFMPVDSAGRPIPEGPGVLKHYFLHTGTYLQSAFAADPNVPSSSSVNGSGVGNVREIIPEGDYYVVVSPLRDNLGIPRDDYISPIFHHTYYKECGDYFTGKSVRCALYQMRLYGSNYPSKPKGLALNGGDLRALPLKRGATVPPGRITEWVPE